MTLVETLKAARARIADPKRWTTVYCARDSRGDGLTWGFDRHAVCWCALGAAEAEIKDAAQWPHRVKLYRRLNDAAEELFGKAASEVNDDPYLGHAAVLQIYDKAIQDSEAVSP